MANNLQGRGRNELLYIRQEKANMSLNNSFQDKICIQDANKKCLESGCSPNWAPQKQTLHFQTNWLLQIPQLCFAQGFLFSEDLSGRAETPWAPAEGKIPLHPKSRAGDLHAGSRAWHSQAGLLLFPKSALFHIQHSHRTRAAAAAEQRWAHTGLESIYSNFMFITRTSRFQQLLVLCPYIRCTWL